MNHKPFNARSDALQFRSESGQGDDIACVKCGAIALDTGLECGECGHDNYKAVTGRPFDAKRQTMTTTEHSKPVESGERAELIEELMSEAANLRAYYAMFGLPPVPDGQLSQERAAALLAADDKPLTTNSVVDQKGANVDDKAGGEVVALLQDATKAIEALLNAHIGTEIAATTQFDQKPRYAKMLYEAQREATDVLHRIYDTSPQSQAEETMEQMAERLALKGWQSVVCSACGSETAVGYPKPQAAQPAERVACNWSLTDDDNMIYESACGEAWVFNDGGPKENNVRFCQGCGKPVDLLGITAKDKSS